MRFKIGGISSIPLMVSALLIGGVTGCVDETEISNEGVQYTPEERPLGVQAGSDMEVAPGDSVTLSGRLVGTVTDETLLWTQVSGSSITEVSDWTQAEISLLLLTQKEWIHMNSNWQQ